ncbi:hypothetical protein [Saccharothrix stipae]
MWTQLNVWVMRGENACLVDDNGNWTVFTTDAHGKPFLWKGVPYAQGLRLSQPGHLAVEIPPGAYVVWAEREEDQATIRTHKAVVQVGFEPQVGVRLLPDVRRGDPDPHDCAVAITGVVGVGSPTPGVVRVTGTASGCDQLQVTVSGSGGSKSRQVAVDANGEWTAELAEVPGIACGRPASARAACASDPNCRDTVEVERLECVPGTGPGTA